jgi:hypothetical protein
LSINSGDTTPILAYDSELSELSPDFQISYKSKGGSAVTTELDQNPTALLRDTLRKDHIEYRKWIVSLATFVLTVSLGLVGLVAKTQPLQYKWVLIAGWLLMGTCIFLNWLIIKRLIGILLLAALSSEEPSLENVLSALTKIDLQLYAFIQNQAFLLGVFAVGLGLVLNL